MNSNLVKETKRIEQVEGLETSILGQMKGFSGFLEKDRLYNWVVAEYARKNGRPVHAPQYGLALDNLLNTAKITAETEQGRIFYRLSD